VIGDVINATARVGSLTKYYGVLFLATHDVCKRLTRAPPRKGRHIPLELFELRHKFSPKNFDKIAKTYAEAFVRYQEGKFRDAERLFRALSGFDKPSSILAALCVQFAAQPPAQWHGIFSLTAK